MAQPNQPAICISGLTKTFGHLYALRKVDFISEPGEFVTILGPNGAGKTTLIRIISTLSKASEGKVQLFGFDVAKQPDRVRRNIGVIGHQTFLYDDLTAEENLKFYGRLYEVPGLAGRIDESLAEVGLSHRRADLVRGFSRGMQQRLAIARAMLHEPGVLLLDEPYTGLDQHAALILTQWLAKLRQQNRTTLMVTHNLERGLELANRIVILNKGKISFNEYAEGMHLDTLKQRYVQIVEGGGAA